MTTAIGIVLVVIAVAIAIYWLVTGKRNKPLFRFVCSFVAIVGFLLLLKDKLVEITFKDVLSIKTSAEKASADAQTIATIFAMGAKKSRRFYKHACNTMNARFFDVGKFSHAI